MLLDESLPRSLKGDLVGHDVLTVPEMGWAGKKNTDLLKLAEGSFDVFITADQNLEYQQNLAVASIPVIVLSARTTRMADLRPLIPKLLAQLDTDLKSGEAVQIIK